jgi:hypothetical protein
MAKLTKAQREVLVYLDQPHIISMSAFAMGANMRTVGALTRVGLIEQEPPKKIVITKNTFLRITDAGRAALSPSPHQQKMEN